MTVSGDRKTLERVASRASTGEGAHVEAGKVFSGLDWNLAGSRPRGAPHSLFQLVNHLIFWQSWAVAWLDGRRPRIPRHAAGSWPGKVAPASPAEWMEAVRRFQAGLADLGRACRTADPLSQRGGKSRLEMMQTIGAHNSYHCGQAVLMRQLLGDWPPPSGGLTW